MAAIASLESSFAVSLRRYTDGMSIAQIAQYRDLCLVALTAVEGYMASARGEGLHRDVVRHFQYERARWQRHIAHLEMLLPAQPISTFRPNKERPVRETLDPEVAPIRRTVQGKPIDEIRTLAQTIDAEVTILERSIFERTREGNGAHDFSIDRDRLTVSRRRKELEYLSQLVYAAHNSGVAQEQ